MLKALNRIGSGGGGGNFNINANSVWANPGPTTANGQSVPIGDPLAGGLFVNATGELVATPPRTYYLVGVADDSGIVGTTVVGTGQPFYQAAHSPTSSAAFNIPGTISGTSAVTFANFITPPLDPGCDVFPTGNAEYLLYCNVDAPGNVATIALTVNRITPDGVSTTVLSSTPVNVTATGVTAYKVHAQKLATTALTYGPYDRLVFVVRVARVSGSASFTFTFTSDGVGSRSTATSTILGTGVPSPSYGSFDVRLLGAPADARTYTDGIMTAGSANLQSTSATFGKQDEGKVIFVNGAGVGGVSGAPFASTIATFVDTHNVTCAGTADTTTSAVQTLTGAVLGDIGTSGTSGYYLPGVDTISVVGGTSSITAVLNVVTTQINPDTDTTPAVAIVNPGSLGIPGNWIFQTTTQTGTPAKIRVSIGSTGSATSVSLISSGFNGGFFVTNPGTAAEPLSNLDSNLAGLTVSIASIGVRTVSVANPGAYTVVPPDPFSTTAGSTSGAAGCTLDGNWAGSGQFAYGANARDKFDSAISLAINSDVTSRTIVRIPAGIYMLDGAVLSTITKPVLFVGDGMGQTIIIVAPTYAGPHVFGWTGLFPTPLASPPAGVTGSVLQSENGWGVANLTIAGFTTATPRQHAFVVYDSCDNMIMQNVEVRYLNGSALKTGALGTTLNAYLRESTLGPFYFRNCGDNGFPVIDLDSVGVTGGANNLVMAGNIVFPKGPGLAIRNHTTKRDGVKFLFFPRLRIERSIGQTFFGDLWQIGSTTDLNACSNIYAGDVQLVGAGAGVSAIALYGMTETTRPHDIEISDLTTTGPMLGTGLSLNAGYNVYINSQQLEGRTANVATGNHSDYRVTTTAGSGSTTGNVVTVASPSGANVGAAVVMTVPARVVVSQTGTLMTVSSVTSGRLLVNSYAVKNATSATGYGVESIVSFGSGSGGTGTYNMSLSQTIAAGTTIDFNYFEARNVISSTTTTSVIGSLQGSAATWSSAPQSGDTISFQSLVDADFEISAGGQERFYTYSLGTGVAALMSRSMLVYGQPGLVGTIPGDLTFSGELGFNGTAPIAKPTITGSRGGNAALASVLTALANYGLIVDSSS